MRKDAQKHSSVRTSLARFLSAPTVCGSVAAAASTLYLLPRLPPAVPDFITSTASRLPVCDVLLGQFVGRERLQQLVVGTCAFCVGYVGKKYALEWLRIKALRALFKYQDWIYSGNSLKTKVWGTMVGLLEGPGPYSMQEFQDCLPKLPVPDLDQTLDRWLEVSRSFSTDSQYEATRKAVQEFRHNEGPKIQKYLKDRASKTANWLTDYWMYVAYLSGREPLLCYSNYFTTTCVTETRTVDPLARAACCLSLYARYEREILNNELEPILLQGRVPLCMKGYQYLFNTVRLPGEHLDTVAKYPNNRYVIVIRNGRYYKLEMYAEDQQRPKQMTPLTDDEIKIQLQRICSQADSESTPEPAVAALTAQNRTVWAKHREQLKALNGETLSTLEKAMFVISLDTSSPKDVNEFALAVTTGKGNDRWFDKSFNVVTFANAYLGNNIEHSVLDAMVFVAMTQYAMFHERYENGDVYRVPGQTPRQLPDPPRLRWNVKGMEDAIEKAVVSFNSLASDLDLFVMTARYGKGVMKKARLSPDGYFQMALQLAYHRLHKVTPKTYEPSTSRLYYEGRTETVHPISQSSIDWVASMDDSGKTVAERTRLLRSAVQHQNKFRLDATVGRGCDRHLVGLMCASRELGMDMPKIFTDEAFRSPFVLSTSQTPTHLYELLGDGPLIYNMCHGGFGPSTADGYGVHYYFYGDQMFFVSVTSWHSCPKTSAARYAQFIDTALEDMKKLFN